MLAISHLGSSVVFRPSLQKLRAASAVNDALQPLASQENLKRLALLALFAVPFNLIHILVFWTKVPASPEEVLWRQGIMLSHAALALLFTSFGLLAHRLRHGRSPSWAVGILTRLAIGAVLAFAVAIACIDQWVTPNITPLLLGCTLAGLAFLVRPGEAAAFYAATLAAFEAGMQFSQPDPQLRLSNQVNGLSACGLGMLLSVILWQGFARIQRQQEELAEKHRQLEYLAGHDALTGLLNRREFDRLIRAELARAERSLQPLSLLTVDLDHFKQVNDRHGHPVGDKVIRQTADLLLRHTRAGDSVARFGGEEFILLLPDTDATEAAKHAENLRRLLETTPVTLDHGEVRLTASFGLTSLPARHSASYEALYATADRALYLAKANGRNCVKALVPESIAQVRKRG